MKEYPQTLAAVEAAEFSKWPIVDALLAEIARTKGGERVQDGEYERVAKFLTARGFPAYSKRRIEDFYTVGAWALEHGLAGFQEYAFEWVYEAKRASRGDHERALVILSKTRRKRDIRPDKTPGHDELARFFREAPMELVERVFDGLPQERLEVIGAAAGDPYMTARREYRATEAQMTPLERKEREAAIERMGDVAKRGMAGFASMGIVGHIDQATEELAELVADHSLTPETWEPIAVALVRLIEEAKVAAAMVGLDLDIEEVGR